MRPLVNVAVAIWLIAGPSANAQPARDEGIAQGIAWLKQGRPPHISPEEWEDLRMLAIASFAEEGPNARGAIPFLIETLSDPSPRVAVVAAGALLKIDPVQSRPVAIATLATAVEGGSPEAREEALDVLGSIEPVTPEIERLLLDVLRGEGTDRHDAAHALRHVPPDRIAAVVPTLSAALADPDRQVRFSAIDTLGTFGTQAAAAVPMLRRLLQEREKDPWMFAAAAEGLARVDPEPEPSLVTLLSDLLQSKERAFRERGLSGLGEMGPGAAAAVPALVSLLNDPDRFVRCRAIDVIAAIGPAAAAAGPELQKQAAAGVDVMDSSCANSVQRALERIGAVTPPPTWSRVTPESDLPTALEQLRSTDAEVRRRGLMSIEAHAERGAEAVPALLATLKDPDLAIRYRAAYAVTSVDPAQAAPALPVLVEMMRSDVRIPGSSPRLLASVGLGRLGTAGADALVAALRDSSPETRQTAAGALMGSDEFPASAAPALLAAVRDESATVRLQSLATLISRNVDPGLMVPAMMAALGDASQEVRVQAASGLGMYGSASRPAEPVLRKMAHEADRDISISAAAAVVAIDPDAGRDLLPFFVTELSRETTGTGTFVIGGPDADLNGPTRRLQSLWAIGRLGPRASSALPVLIRVWDRDTGMVQIDAGVAIALVDPKSAPTVVTSFVNALNAEDDGETHLAVLHRLKALGRAAGAAEPVVARFLTSDDPDIRKAAGEALSAIRAR
ncbi:MAG TPA: HEAT repeat domain-containing protein [Vicinamibacterales bacterium]|nr:HEAT repeat domain-containing protein [Vicinamibacterales bacterium]